VCFKKKLGFLPRISGEIFKQKTQEMKGEEMGGKRDHARRLLH